MGEASASTAYLHAWAQTEAAQPPLELRWAQAHLLPKPDRSCEVVALVPAGALSWHRVTLPAGLHKQRARLEAALHGLLEERLLDDPEQLHMALPPQWSTTPQPWVAVCSRPWLQAHLSALEATGTTVHRIVPEFAPHPERLHITATGDAETGWLWLSDEERGVWRLPLAQAHRHSLALSPEQLQAALIQAEPAAFSITSERLQTPARLMPPAQHWWAALQSGWDLAQFGFQTHPRARLLKTAQRSTSQLWHQPQWGMARWGIAALLLAQLLGLNVWAWKTRSDWQAQQASWTQILRQSFPGTTVVVDAPLQMAQQVGQLRQASHWLGPSDLESMLGALGQALPPQTAAPRQWRFEPGLLELSAWPLSPQELQNVQKKLATQGYPLRAEGDIWRMRIQEGSP